LAVSGRISNFTANKYRKLFWGGGGGGGKSLVVGCRSRSWNQIGEAIEEVGWGDRPPMWKKKRDLVTPLVKEMWQRRKGGEGRTPSLRFHPEGPVAATEEKEGGVWTGTHPSLGGLQLSNGNGKKGENKKVQEKGP